MRNFLSRIFVIGTFLILSSLVASAQDNDNEKVYKTLTGLASWYSNKFDGRRTANGEIFRQKKLTCASNHFPLNTWLRVTDLDNGKVVIVWMNDRMGVSKKSKRIIDLSRAAAQKIGLNKEGLTRVKVEDLGRKYKKETKTKK